MKSYFVFFEFALSHFLNSHARHIGSRASSEIGQCPSNGFLSSLHRQQTNDSVVRFMYCTFDTARYVKRTAATNNLSLGRQIILLLPFHTPIIIQSYTNLLQSSSALLLYCYSPVQTIVAFVVSIGYPVQEGSATTVQDVLFEPL